MATPFITEQDLVDYLGRGDPEDPGMAIAVDAACDICRDIAEQPFTQVAAGTATLDGTGTDALVLPRVPVNTVGTVLVNGTAITDYTLAKNGMLFRGTPDAAASTWDDEYTYPPKWPKGRQNVTVVYNYGYSTANLPRSVKMVALTVAARLVVQGIALQEVQGDRSIRYAVAATDLTPGERAILRKHKGR